ncbi:serine hydrolase [Candidatus Saccharibacteria bacterium]|jgi:beta-lactamase class A|nr:serine hydrolase [Candidatus Saccharibacteria bacterium]MBP9131822.1 serine hydrolase [Candidatus Saccharibacteria bacterium]
MNWSRTAICILDESGESKLSLLAGEKIEAASTIKLAIARKAFDDALSQGIKPNSVNLSILDKHLSLGSGILNWQKKRKLSLEKLIAYMLKYSDCVATNVLVEYVGGKDVLNEWLSGKGYLNTRLLVDRLYPIEAPTQDRISITTASELALIARDVLSDKNTNKSYSLITKYLRRNKTSWLYEHKEQNKDLSLTFKTGSIIYKKAGQLNYINAVGSAGLNGNKVFFSMLSEYVFDENFTNQDQADHKDKLANRLIREIRNYIDVIK